MSEGVGCSQRLKGQSCLSGSKQQTQSDIQSNAILVTSRGICCKTDFHNDDIQWLLSRSRETEAAAGGAGERRLTVDSDIFHAPTI